LVTGLATYFREYLDHDSPEVLTYAHAVLGLHRLAQLGLVQIESERLLQAAQRLNDLRHEGHWEPSWFNAYGGTIEATVTVLEVFQSLGGDLLASAQRDAVRHLLSTRDEWGGWHNPRGTAAAIRGLLILDGGGTEVPSTVVVRLDGEEVARVAVDPSDPFLSAVSLRALDLSAYARPGTHTLEVAYDGRLEPEVRVIVRHWEEAAPGEADALLLSTSLESFEASVGAVVPYAIRVESTTAATRLVEVVVAAPANAEIDRQSVESLRERGLVQSFSWQVDGLHLVAELAGEATLNLELRLVASRPGQATVPPVRAEVAASPGHDGTVAMAVLGERLSVSD
jgi:hypothetical protein